MKGVELGLDKEKKLLRLIQDVTKYVPFYKPYQELGEQFSNPIDALMRLPITDKKMIHNNNDAFFSQRIARSKREELLITEVTTGSSGLPIMCYKTKEERLQLALSAWKQRKAIDNTVNQSSMFCLLHSHSSQKKIVEDTRNLNPGNISKVLHYLRDEFKPKIIHCSPSDIFEYARFIEVEEFQLFAWRLSFIETNSEILTPEQKQIISCMFQTRVINNYGCREAWNVAYECQEGKLHLSDEVYVEIMNMDTGEIMPPDSGEYGEVVITALPIKHFPFIRYKLGDIGRLSTESCACGLPNEVLELHEARKINLIHRLTSGNKLTNGVSLFKGVFTDLVAAGHSDIVQSISQYKIIQTAPITFNVYLVLHTDLSERLTATFTHYSRKRIGEHVVFHFHQVDSDNAVFKGKNYSFLSKV